MGEQWQLSRIGTHQLRLAFESMCDQFQVAVRDVNSCGNGSITNLKHARASVIAKFRGLPEPRVGRIEFRFFQVQRRFIPQPRCERAEQYLYGAWDWQRHRCALDRFPNAALVLGAIS